MGFFQLPGFQESDSEANSDADEDIMALLVKITFPFPCFGECFNFISDYGVFTITYLNDYI